MSHLLRSKAALFEATDCACSALSVNCLQLECCLPPSKDPSLFPATPGTRWMEQLGLVDASIRFRDLVLIGSHDAASFSIGGCQPYAAVAQCQRFDILQQLAAGVRVLDIRVAPTKAGDFSIWHGCLEGGDLLEHVLDPLRTFVQDNPQEVILLQLVPEFGRDYPPAQKKRTLDLVRETLGEYLLNGSHTSDLLQKWTLGDLRDKPKARVVVLLQSRFFGLDLREKQVLVDYGFASMDKWLRSLWFNTRDTETLLEYTLDEVARHGHRRKQFHCSQLVLTPGVGGLTDVLAALFGLNKLRPASLAYKLYKDHRLGRYLRENADKGWNLVLLDYIDLCPWVTYLMTALNFPVSLKVLFAAYDDDTSTVEVTDSVRTCVCRDRVLYMDSVRELLKLPSGTGSLTVVYSLGDEIKVLSMALSDSTEMGDAMLVSAFVNSCEDDTITAIPMDREKGHLKGCNLLPEGSDVSSMAGTVIAFEKVDGAYDFKLCNEEKVSSESRELVFAQDSVSPTAVLSSGSEKLPSTVDSEHTVQAENGELLVLISQQSLGRGVVQNQQKAITILEANGILFTTLDGADPANKEARNELFGISEQRGKYPQFFIVKNGVKAFYGDYETFSYANEVGSLKGDLVSASRAEEESVFNESPKTHDPSRVATNPSTPAPSAASAPTGASVLVLISNQSFDRTVLHNQQNAMTILDSKGIGYTTVDGADPVKKEDRNALFTLSGRRGKYPQFFVTHGEETSFFGGIDEFNEANETGSLSSDLGGEGADISMAVASQDKLLTVDEPSRSRDRGASLPAQPKHTAAESDVNLPLESKHTVSASEATLPAASESSHLSSTSTVSGLPLESKHTNSASEISLPAVSQASNVSSNITLPLESRHSIASSDTSLPAASQSSNISSDISLPLESKHSVASFATSLPAASQSSNISAIIPADSSHSIAYMDTSFPAESMHSIIETDTLPDESRRSIAETAASLPAESGHYIAEKVQTLTQEPEEGACEPPSAEKEDEPSSEETEKKSSTDSKDEVETADGPTDEARTDEVADKKGKKDKKTKAEKKAKKDKKKKKKKKKSGHSNAEMETSMSADSRHSIAASDIGLSEESTSAGELLFLITYQTFNREVYPMQQNAMALLDANDIKYTALVGDDPDNKEARDNLFEISEMHGIYPQFFGFQDGDIFFLGDYEDFCDANEDGELGTWAHGREP